MGLKKRIPVLFVIIAGLLTLACGEGPDRSSEAAAPDFMASPAAGPLAALYGKILSDDPVLVLPGYGWYLSPDKRGWLIASLSSTIIYVVDQPGEPFTLLLDLKEGTALKNMEAEWDGLAEVCGIRLISPDRAEIIVPAGALKQGLHELTLQCFHQKKRKRTEQPEVPLTQVRYKFPGRSDRLSPHAWDRARILFHFLMRDVAGLPEAREKFGGFMFDGPQETRLRLSPAHEGYLHFKPHNLSAQAAAFVIEHGGEQRRYDVEPMRRRSFRLPVTGGDFDLKLRVEGDADGLYFWGAPHVTSAPNYKKAPIILITLDTTRRDRVAPYAKDPGVTPAIRAFSREAAVFTRGYTTAPWTLPAHASIFTGLYPSGHGAGVRRRLLDAHRITLAELLRRHGYYTAGFAGGTYTASSQGVAQGFCHYRDPDNHSTDADRLTNYAKAFLKNHGEAPFFLFLNYFDPHFPYRAPEAFMENYEVDRKMEALDAFPEWQAGLAKDDAVRLDALVNQEKAVPEAIKDVVRAAYEAEISFLDRELGALFEALKRFDLYESALIILVSDHGEFLGEHDFLFHGYRLDPELSEIPFIIKWPGQKASLKIDTAVSLVDLFPTVLDAAGIDIPRQSGIVLKKSGSPLSEDRPFIVMEEHGNRRVHYLKPDVRKISDHLYGAVSKDGIVTVWEDDHRCFAWREGAWVSVPCGRGREENMASILRQLETREGRRLQPIESLMKKERDHLRALGYVE